MSRYIKIAYFYEKILKEKISKNKISRYSNLFSKIMRKDLVNKNILIKDSINFIIKNYKTYNFSIVSASDQKELRYICEKLEIHKYFKFIYGSPTTKIELIKRLMLKERYEKNVTCLIGDSINDHEAAHVNGITFFGYNNIFLKSKSNYIYDFNFLN